MDQARPAAGHGDARLVGSRNGAEVRDVADQVTGEVLIVAPVHSEPRTQRSGESGCNLPRTSPRYVRGSDPWKSNDAGFHFTANDDLVSEPSRPPVEARSPVLRCCSCGLIAHRSSCARILGRRPVTRNVSPFASPLVPATFGGGSAFFRAVRSALTLASR